MYNIDKCFILFIEVENMKKILIIILSLSVCINIFMIIPTHATEIDLAPNALSAYLIEYNSGKVIYAKHETDRLYPASMTKMMGLLLLYEAHQAGKLKWSDKVTTSELAASMGGSQVFLEVNETMSARDLLKAICIASANDAMVAIGEMIAGSNEHFVERMNEKGKALKLTNTNFVNATGLHDPKHYSCAKDMAIIAKALIEVGGKDLLSVTSKYDAYIREKSDKKFWLVNTNKLLKQYPGVDGLKTGFTQEARSCITVSAKKDNLRLISVVMGEPNSKMRNTESKQMLDYGFSQFSTGILMNKNKIIQKLTFDKGKPKHANLRLKDDVTYLFEKGKEAKERKRKIELLNGNVPFKKGDVIGSVNIEMDNGYKIKTDLYIDSDIIALNYFDILLKSIKRILS